LISNIETLKSKKVAYFICCGFNENWKNYYEQNIPKDLLDNAIIYDTFGGEMDMQKQKGFDKFITKMVSKNIDKNNNDEKKDKTVEKEVSKEYEEEEHKEEPEDKTKIVNGPPGKDGKDGRDGVDGKDGEPGKDGKDGEPGGNTYIYNTYYTDQNKVEQNKREEPKNSEELTEKVKKDVFFEIIFMTYSFVHTKINEEAFPNAISLYDKEKMTGRGKGKYWYKSELRSEAEIYLREQMSKYFPNSIIEYIV